jgi:hypothetical protein
MYPQGLQSPLSEICTGTYYIECYLLYEVEKTPMYNLVPVFLSEKAPEKLLKQGTGNIFLENFGTVNFGGKFKEAGSGSEF